jgi:predicted glycosyl hydrolase (DUF1957 family)
MTDIHEGDKERLLIGHTSQIDDHFVRERNMLQRAEESVNVFVDMARAQLEDLRHQVDRHSFVFCDG